MNLNRSAGILLSLSLIALTAGRSYASTVVPLPPPPFASVTVTEPTGETTVVDLSQYITQGEGQKVATLNADLFVLGNHIMVNGIFNPDPFISFGATTINAGPGPVAYSFTFGTPIVPGLYDSATSTGGISLTAGTAGSSTVDNGGATPLIYITGAGTVGASPTNLGVDLGTGAVTATGTVTTVQSFGPLTSIFAPTFYNNLEATLSYTQTDSSSVASWSGRVTLNSAVPEPTSVIMLGMGTLVLGATSMLRRRAV